MEKEKNAYIDSLQFLDDLTKLMILDCVGKGSNKSKNKVPHDKTNRPFPGYQNISVMIVRLRKVPKKWKDPKIEAYEKNLENKMRELVGSHLKGSRKESSISLVSARKRNDDQT